MGEAVAELRIRMLGGFDVEVDGHARDLPALRRARSLLAFLALNPGAHPRGALAARFWPDVLDQSARGSLRTALSEMRRALGDGALVEATRDEVSLRCAWTDVAELESLAAAGRAVEALELYGGPLLPGLDDDWVYERRDELRDRAGELLAGLAAEAEAGGDLEAALERTRAWAALDPLDEAPVRELIRRQAEAGDPAGAIASYERLSERLRSQLGIAPSQATRDAIAAVRSAQPAAAAAAGGVVALVAAEPVDRDEGALRLVRAAIREHGGEEAGGAEGGLLAAFASAVDAVRAAAAAQEALAAAGRPGGARVGISAGEPFRHGDELRGTPVAVARGLCAAAGPGQVLVARLVCDLLGDRGDFELRDRAALGLETGAVAVAELEWSPARRRRVALPGPLADASATRLVGRGAELARLAEAWTRARAGALEVVLIGGEPGIGKTRLAAEAARRAHARDGALVMFGRCDEVSLTPYQPFVEALDRYAGQIGADELSAQAGDDRAPLARLVPAIGRALPAPAPGGGESSRFALFAAVTRLLGEAARARPAVVVLDDLHWADPPSLLLLPHALRELRGVPLLVIGAYRTTEVEAPLEDALAALRRMGAADEIELAGLGLDDVADLIATRASEDRAGEAAAIHERSGGNPFFVEELIRSQEAGGVPRSVEDLIRRRLVRLEEGDADVLAAAAVAGAEFDAALLAAATGAGQDELIASFERAVAAGALREVSGAPGRFAFAHALVRETIYSGLSAARRARLHERLGEALEASAPDEAPATLAYHFAAAGDHGRALAHAVAAARAARAVAAAEAAARHYDDAVELAGRAGRDAASDPLVRELLIERAALRHQRTDVAGSVSDAEAALAGARAAGDRRAELLALSELGYARRETDLAAAFPHHGAALAIARELADTRAEVETLNRLSLMHTVRLEIDRALADGERALELARREQSPELVARALDALKLAALWLGDLDRLEALTGELLELLPEEQPWYRGWALMESAFVPIARRRPELAEQRLAEAERLARKSESVTLAVLVGEARAWFLRERGRVDESIAEARAALDALSRRGSQFAGSISATLALALVEGGDPVAAAAELERGLAVASRLGAPGEMLRCAGQLAHVRLLVGDAGAARAAAAEAERLLGRATLPPGASPLICAHGVLGAARVRLADGDADAARALAEPVRAAAERSGWLELSESAAELLGGYASGQKTS